MSTRGLDKLKEMQEEPEMEEDNSFLDGLDEEDVQLPPKQQRSATDTELLTMILAELKKLNATGGTKHSAQAPQQPSGGYQRKSAPAATGEGGGVSRSRIQTTISSLEEKTSSRGAFLRVKLATQPVVWASVWDQAMFDTFFEAYENGLVLSMHTEKKGDFTTIKSASIVGG